MLHSPAAENTASIKNLVSETSDIGIDADVTSTTERATDDMDPDEFADYLLEKTATCDYQQLESHHHFTLIAI